LEYWIQELGNYNFNLVRAHTSHYIAASTAVKSTLVSRGVPSEKMDVIYEHIENHKPEPSSLHDLLGLAKDALIIAGSGAEDFRKGKDLFLTVATSVLEKTDKQVFFVWVGGKLNNQLNFDHNKIKHKDKIHFVEHIPNANKYFSDFYLFLMLSRDDPFPVVNLEAGRNGVPIICFKDSGGTEELIDFDTSSIITYLDIASYSNRLLYLLNNPLERNRIGMQLQRKIEESYTIDKIGNELLNLIKRKTE
jgi:glycosyltransferase involved in cell wall biosynthesis